MNSDELKKLGDEKYKSGDYYAAIDYFSAYLETDPKNAPMHNIIGYLYEKIDRYETVDEQIKYYEKAAKLDPTFNMAIRNLAFAYSKKERYQDAIAQFHKLFNLGAIPDDYFAYACLKIKLGDFEEGWKYYEYRFCKEYGRTEYPIIEKPRWEGQNISNKTLLVQYEQGFGDSLLFFRYLYEVKPLVKKIIFRVQNELVNLFKTSNKDNNIEIVGMSTELSELSFDYHISLLSLLYVMKANINNIPLSEGYIKADENKVKAYKDEFFNNDCFKIGIAWHGMVVGNKRRNIPLQDFSPLTSLKNVKVYSFQKNAGYNQLSKLPPDVEIIDLGKTFNDFSDTAAAMANIDLFVTSDNGVFNLAGAMGKRTFLLLNKYSEWRWFFDNDSTPWYKSVKIFKKERENDNWNLLIKRVIETIQREQK